MKCLASFATIASGLLLLAGCDKAPAPQPQKVSPPTTTVRTSPLPPPQPFSFTATNEVVQRESLNLKTRQFVEFDFDGDGKNDLAVHEPIAHPSGEKPHVSIYIQRTQNLYVLGGVIAEDINAEIIGLAYKQGKQFTDLVLVYRYDDGATEVVSYKNDGNSFRRVQEEGVVIGGGS